MGSNIGAHHAKNRRSLDRFGVAYEKRNCFRTVHQDLMFKHAEEARSRGIKVIITVRVAQLTARRWSPKTTLPVIGVPVKSRALSGVDSLFILSRSECRSGVPVATSDRWLECDQRCSLCPPSPLSRGSRYRNIFVISQKNKENCRESTNGAHLKQYYRWVASSVR